MEKEHTRSLSFSIAGGFVTQTAREWFWLEHKPWPVVEEFLLSSMTGTEQTEEELKALARDVVFGRAQFIGNTGDGSYALTEDSQDLVVQNVERMARSMKSAEKDLKELQDKYLKLVDRIEDEGLEWLLGPKSGPTKCPTLVSPMLDSFLKQVHIEEKFEDNYGWLEPNGTFHPAEWGEHQKWAHDKLEEMGEAVTWDLFKCGDRLVEAGWVLLHNPGRGVAQVTKNEVKPLTKAQREFLFGYYADRGLDDQATKYLEDE